jgi:DNA-binding transcriptional regulator PaaX
MRASTEEFLYFLLWTAEGLMRPSWRNLNDSFEGWAWRNGLGRRLQELERQKLLERHPAPDSAARVVRLTEAGRRQALGGRDPIERWARGWDGRWRFVLFDLPQQRRDLRMRLWRYLRQEGFGYLQNSVWITPDSLESARQTLMRDALNIESLTFFEGRPCGGETDRDVVSGAWDFARINALYDRHLACLRDPPTDTAPARLREWARRERRSWDEALRADPLLPQALWPGDYLGKRAWDTRCQALAKIAGQLGWSQA